MFKCLCIINRLISTLWDTCEETHHGIDYTVFMVLLSKEKAPLTRYKDLFLLVMAACHKLLSLELIMAAYTVNHMFID